MEPASSLRVTAAPTLREKVGDRIREAIASGQFAPGERLVERELCELTGVSRTSLREALRELVAEGLLSRLPNRMLTVTVIGPREAEDIYQIRSVLEGLVARLVVRVVTDEQLATLSAEVDALTAQFDADEPEPFLSIKDQLYDHMFEMAGNEELHAMLRQIYARVRRLRCASIESKERRQEIIGQVGRLFDAFRSREEDLASLIAIANVQRAGVVALARLRSSSLSAAPDDEAATGGTLSAPADPQLAVV
jgi:DNA-binding GntR family transcriptional regulator